MNKDTALRMLTAKLECLNRQTRGDFFECNNDLCDDCNLLYDQGNTGEYKKALSIAIDSLKEDLNVK